MSKSFLPFCLWALTILVGGTATYAQNPPTQPTFKPGSHPPIPPSLQGKKVVLPKPISYDNPRSPLKDAGDIPVVPQYPGKFVRGDVQDLANERVYTAVLYAKEKQKDVFEWYRNELSVGSWKLLSASTNSVTASDKSGNIVVVGVSNATIPGFKSSLSLNVRQRTAK
jgi:hypothetical protein